MDRLATRDVMNHVVRICPSISCKSASRNCFSAEARVCNRCPAKKEELGVVVRNGDHCRKIRLAFSHAGVVCLKKRAL